MKFKKKDLTIGHIKAMNKLAGFHWFDQDTIRFFNSKLPKEDAKLIGGEFFVSSEKSPWDRRGYTIRQWKHKEKNVDTIGDMDMFRSKRRAEKVAYKLAEIKRKNRMIDLQKEIKKYL